MTQNDSSQTTDARVIYPAYCCVQSGLLLLFVIQQTLTDTTHKTGIGAMTTEQLENKNERQRNREV